MIALLSIGSTGNSAILLPSFVNSPRSFNAPSAYSSSKARISVSPGGGSMNSKPIRSLIPSDLSSRTTMPRFVRWISGTVLASSSLANAHFVYKRKAFPGPTRPARPALWLADAREHYKADISGLETNQVKEKYLREQQRAKTCPSSDYTNSASRNQDQSQTPRHRS